jgi:hypothetical protein
VAAHGGEFEPQKRSRRLCHSLELNDLIAVTPNHSVEKLNDMENFAAIDTPRGENHNGANPV